MNQSKFDKDAFVEQADWEQCAKNLAQARGWQPDSKEYTDILEKHVQVWKTFWEPTDQNGNGKVSLWELIIWTLSTNFS